MDDAEAQAEPQHDVSFPSKSRKKKRSRSGNPPEESADSSPSKRPKLARPLAGKVVAVSTRVGDSTDINYKTVIEWCQQAGASCTGQVHKRVDYVIATQSAVSAETQRVRKAWQRGIAVVQVAWVRQCLDEKRLIVPIPEDLVVKSPSGRNVKDATTVSGTKANIDRKQSQNRDEEGEGWSEPVSLGCCCVCHELGTAADCEWCVGCSVNAAAAAST